jgi:hypothetical protein
MTPTEKPPVEGLPTGVEFVRIGYPKKDEYYITNEPDGKGGHVAKISKAPEPVPGAGQSTEVIIQPADGYGFRVDIRTMALVATKVWPPKQLSAKFTVDNQADQDAITAKLNQIKAAGLPVEISE